MIEKILPTAIATASVYLAFMFFSNWYEAKARREIVRALTVEKVTFRASRLLLFVLLLSGILGSGLSASIIIIAPNKDIAGVLVFGGIALFWFVLICIGMRLIHSSCVTVDAHTLEYVQGEKRLVVERHSIKDVYIQSWLIVIDTGAVRRHTIPMVFSKSYQIVALLKT